MLISLRFRGDVGGTGRSATSTPTPPRCTARSAKFIQVVFYVLVDTVGGAILAKPGRQKRCHGNADRSGGASCTAKGFERASWPGLGSRKRRSAVLEGARAAGGVERARNGERGRHDGYQLQEEVCPVEGRAESKRLNFVAAETTVRGTTPGLTSSGA